MTTSTITFSRPLPGQALEPVSRARADYVFACMKTNGETRRALERCSCSIDVIASILPLCRRGDLLKPFTGA